MTETETQTQPELAPPDGADREPAHLVDQRHDRTLVDYAYLHGDEVTALCGARFVPTRNPRDGRPVCTACVEALGKIAEASGS